MTAPTPYYTATAGRADTGAGLRAKLYAVLTVLLGVPAIVQLFGLITADQAVSVTKILAGVLGLVGAGGLGLAASKTNKQVSNGTFDPAPANPVGDVFASLNQIKQQVDDTVAHTTAQVTAATAAITGAVAMIPGGGLITSAITTGPVGDFVQRMSDVGISGLVPPPAKPE